MTKRNIGQEIITGLQEIKAWKRGELKLKTYSVEMPRAADVPAIRKELGLSQPEFAGFMGVPGTLRNWGRNVANHRPRTRLAVDRIKTARRGAAARGSETCRAQWYSQNRRNLAAAARDVSGISACGVAVLIQRVYVQKWRRAAVTFRASC
jgi:DNA-binding transcriptional regulator YiaG